MSRVCVYIDGFNLYFGLKSKGWRKHYWLDLRSLAGCLLKPGQQLEKVHYFTARIKSDGHNHKDLQRQNTYLEALDTLPGLQTHYGQFLEKQHQCRNCGARWIGYEEKMTDVNIAVQMLTDAFEDRFDTAILVSGDSDLTTPIKTLRNQFPDQYLIVAFPPHRHSKELSMAAPTSFQVGEAKLRQSHLPPSVTRQDGYRLERPDTWR